ncbi:MAG: glycoside hydrolase family 32 protein, partial [Turicibacter sanguinis]
RLKYHMMPTVGWMNDPNGLIQYKGDYHLFYQYYPYDDVWGPMHWGHATSKDLLKWTDQEVALAPDQSYESGCFSGGAIVKDDELYLMYTSHIEAADNGGVQKQTQSIAVSHDGKTFVKYANNPVIKETAIPEGASKADFRDPNPSIEMGTIVLVGSKTEQKLDNY